MVLDIEDELIDAMRFEVKAIGADGRVQRLELRSLDRTAAVQDAEQRGLSVLSVRRTSHILEGLTPRERFSVVLFSQELLALTEAGLPLVDAIEILAQRERRATFRAVLAGVIATLRQGRPLSAALEHYPHVFPRLYVATVRASERTSDLAPALGRFVAYQAQLDTIKKRIVSAMIYPVLLLFVGGLVTLFLLFYVVPRFGKIYGDRSTDLPMVSQWLLGWGNLVDAHGGLVLGVIALLVAGVILLARSTALRAALSKALWRAPAIGERLKVYQLARFYRTIGMLLRGGMPLVSALDMTADLLHPALRVRLAAARQAVSEGVSVAAAMDTHALTTPVALRLLSVGEQGGNMGEMMDRAAAFHDEEISRWVDWFSRIFEPLLMTVIGLVIGIIVVLMYLPIFELAGSLG